MSRPHWPWPLFLLVLSAKDETRARSLGHGSQLITRRYLNKAVSPPAWQRGQEAWEPSEGGHLGMWRHRCLSSPDALCSFSALRELRRQPCGDGIVGILPALRWSEITRGACSSFPGSLATRSWGQLHHGLSGQPPPGVTLGLSSLG